jgi:hypothetical protein
MPYEELLGWSKYFSLRPPGWRDDQRTHMLLQAQGVKEKGEKLFSSLAALKKAAEDIPEEQRLAQSLVNSGWLSKLQTVAANNNIEWRMDDDQD